MQAATGTRSYRYGKDREGLLQRMKRVEGQARGIQKMIEEDRYCPEIIQQLTALSHAADQVALILLQDHIEGCVTQCIHEGDSSGTIEELLGLIRRVVRA